MHYKVSTNLVVFNERKQHEKQAGMKGIVKLVLEPQFSHI